MRLSRIIKQENADLVALEFAPQKFPVVMPQAASGFVRGGSAGDVASSFKLNELIASQIGVAEREKRKVEERVEQMAIEKMQEIQESAYREAYDIGRAEGKQKAFDEFREDILARVAQLDELCLTITQLKRELVGYNETHLIKLVHQLASRIACQHIEENQESILSIIKAAIGIAHEEENVAAKVSPRDFEFLVRIQENLGKDFEFMKRMKFQASDAVKPGGCIIETNYGVVDSTIDQRIENLWKAMSRKAPVVKDKVG